ncbi:MAG: peptide ABC transporter ATP-binding protein, partial [Hominenteromicrobium sp.]
DVSIPAQVINLLGQLRDELGISILFIAHDLSVVKYFSDRIGVMYFGHLVELAESDELFARPLHGYTQSLLSAIPMPDPHYEKQRTRIVYQPPVYTPEEEADLTLREIFPGHFVRCTEAEARQMGAQTL